MNRPVKNNIDFLSFKNLYELEIVRGTRIINNFSEHIHKKLCVGVLLEGSALLKYKNQSYNLQESDVYLISSGDSHAIQSVDNYGFSHLVFCFGNDINFFDDNKCCEDENIKFTTTVVKDSFLSVKLAEYYNGIVKSQSSLERECIFMGFISDILPYCIIEDSPVTFNADIRKVCEYISKNCTEKLNLSCLAAEANLSKFHFSRLFQKETGLTPYEYLLQEKIKYSKKMILDGNPIADVALMLGFTDQSHFTNTFKKHMGITPLDFLKKNINL